MKTIGLLLSTCLVFVAVTPAMAEDSPQNLALELRIGPYNPQIDDEFSGGTKPFKSTFGDKSALLFGPELDVQIWHGFGSLGLFGAAMYGWVSGKGLDESGAKSSDKTTLSMVPLVGGVVYRFDVLSKRFRIPLVVSLKGGVDYTIWWIRDGVDSIARYKNSSGKSMPGYGGTWGLHWSAGLHLLLDFFEPHTAKVFDNEMGVNNSYLFIEYVGYWVDDFGSKKSFNLSHNGVAFGLAFEL